MNTEYNYVYIRGDYDEHSLPGYLDLFPGDDDPEQVEREINMVVEEYNTSAFRRGFRDKVSREDYIIVKRQVSDWEVVQ